MHKSRHCFLAVSQKWLKCNFTDRKYIFVKNVTKRIHNFLGHPVCSRYLLSSYNLKIWNEGRTLWSNKSNGAKLRLLILCIMMDDIWKYQHDCVLHHLKNSFQLPVVTFCTCCLLAVLLMHKTAEKKGLQRQHLADLGCLQKMLFNMGEVQ